MLISRRAWWRGEERSPKWTWALDDHKDVTQTEVLVSNSMLEIMKLWAGGFAYHASVG